ncbi:MAG: response regulator [Chloroflexota bacterium]
MTRILVVEDEIMVAVDISETLKSWGYTVVGIAGTGEEALHFVADYHPHLVLVDISLGGSMDGIQLAAELRKKYAVPVVYLTAYSDQQTVERLKRTEPFGYILKPFHERVLQITIELALYKHASEQEIVKNEQRLATTLHSIGDAVITTDADGLIEFVNPIAAQLLDYTQDEIKGHPLSEIFIVINEKTGETTSSPIQRVLTEGVVIGLANHTLLVNKNGHRIPIDNSAAPIMGHDNTILGAVLVFRDVSARRQTEMVLNQMQRLDSLGVLAGGIAHDFNNLLTGAMLQITLLQRELSMDSWAYKRTEKAFASLEKASELTEQLLTYAGEGSVELQMIDLNEVIRHSHELFTTGFERDGVIHYELTKQPLMVEADRVQVQQVLHNLIRNGYEAIRPNPDGILHISTSVKHFTTAELTNYLSKEPLQAGGYAVVELKDNGVGMEEVVVERIFEPFFSTKGSGRGLGLAATLGIIQRNDGGIWVQTEPDVGTTFSIAFPRVESQNKPLHESPSHSDTNQMQGKILVVDDDLSVLDAMQDLLEAEGIDVLTAINGREAVSIYEENASSIDLVILDIQMPILNGIEAMKRIYELSSEQKIILMSGYSHHMASPYTPHDYYAFIEKPFEVNSFLATVASALG